MYSYIVLTTLVFFVLLSALIPYSHYESFSGYTRMDCPTRNMSYDLRGDIPVQYRETVWNNPHLNTNITGCRFRTLNLL